MATIPSSAAAATTLLSSATATTLSSGIPVMAATPLKARPETTDDLQWRQRQRKDRSVRKWQPLALTRDVANVTMDTNDVENININALGGADTVTANDLSATSVSQLSINLAASTGSGDASADSVIVNGTANTDNVQLSGNGSSYTVAGLSTVVTVAGSEGSLDALLSTSSVEPIPDASAIPPTSPADRGWGHRRRHHRCQSGRRRHPRRRRKRSDHWWSRQRYGLHG